MLNTTEWVARSLTGLLPQLKAAQERIAWEEEQAGMGGEVEVMLSGRRE